VLQNCSAAAGNAWFQQWRTDVCAYRQTLYHDIVCASGGADLSDDSDIRQWVVALYFAMTTLTTVGYGDITAHSTVEQVCFATSLCSYNMHSHSVVEHVGCAMTAVLWQHAQHMFSLLWGREGVQQCLCSCNMHSTLYNGRATLCNSF